MPQEQQQLQDGGRKHKTRGRKSTKKGGSDALTGLGTAALLFGARTAYDNFLASGHKNTARSPSPSRRRRSGRRTVGGMANLEDVAQDQVQSSMTESFANSTQASNTMNNMMNNVLSTVTGSEGFAPSGGMMSIQDNSVQKGGTRHTKRGKKGGSLEQENKEGGGKKGRKHHKRGKKGGGDEDCVQNADGFYLDSNGQPCTPQGQYEQPPLEQPVSEGGRGKKVAKHVKAKKSTKKGGSSEENQHQKGGKMTYGGALQMYSNQLSSLANQINEMIKSQVKQ